MGAEKKIEIRNAGFGYKKSGKNIVVLDQITLDFYAGDFIGIVGLNGSGKSTLLKSMSGLLPLLAGEVMLDGSPVSRTPLPELAKKIAIVLTEKFGGFNLTAYDVVAAGQIPYTNAFNQLKQEHRTIIDQAIKACDILEHQSKPLNELSDGLFQKTIIAKALAQQTGAILLDEPSAFLDYASKHDLFILLRNLAQSGQKCVLVSSHDLDLLVKYCSKLLIVSGRTAELIPVSEALQNPAFKRIGGGFI